MPLPVAHGIVGAAIVAGLSTESEPESKCNPLLLGAALAMLPDCDLFFVWGLGLGNQLHGGFSHSIVFALACGLFGATILRRPTRRLAVILGLAMTSHGLLDAATSGRWGGVELFWPFSTQRIKIGTLGYFEFFPNPSTDRFIDLLFRGLTIGLLELALFSPLLILVIWIKHRTAVRERAASATRSSNS